MRTIFLSAFLCVFWISQTQANVGVFTGQGQNLRQITSKSVQLVSEEIVIIPGRGRFLFDGTVPGMDQVDYRCKFVLRNLTDEATEVQIGFPVDSQFARYNDEKDKDADKRWVLEYSFIAREDKTTYHIDLVRREPKSKDEARAIFVWKMTFAPKETKTLNVQYRIPMSMTLYSTQRKGDAPRDERLELLTHCLLEYAGYITETGSSWAGNVEKATFTIYTEPFERYLDWRGYIEQPTAGLRPEELACANNRYPVKHPWWFRKVTPEGWQTFKEGVQGIRWEFKDFKPQQPIGLEYYSTQIPRLPQEVDAFVDRFLKFMPAERKKDAAAELEIVKQILLATYGKEPEDAVTKAFASGQVWYSPRKDFSMSALTAEQQAVLKELDRRIVACRAAK